VKLIPPLVINESDVRWFLTAFEDVMTKLHRASSSVNLLARLGRNTMFGSQRGSDEVASK
jgi:ornithine--oxo-acid transaminase